MSKQFVRDKSWVIDAYSRAVAEFLAWCADAGVPSLGHVAPLHVATWIEAQTRVVSAPTVKQRLAARVRF